MSASATQGSHNDKANNSVQ